MEQTEPVPTDAIPSIEVGGHTYLIINKELFDLLIKSAYADGQVDAYRKVEEIRR